MNLMKYTPSPPKGVLWTKECLLTVFFILFTLLACKNDKVRLPISKETMVNVLVDIHIAESYIESVNPLVKDSMAKQYYPQIFKHNGITAKLYDSAFSLLSNQPEMLKSVYDEVLLKIEDRQKHLQGDTIKQVKIDSIPKN